MARGMVYSTEDVMLKTRFPIPSPLIGVVIIASEAHTFNRRVYRRLEVHEFRNTVEFVEWYQGQMYQD